MNVLKVKVWYESLKKKYYMSCFCRLLVCHLTAAKAGSNRRQKISWERGGNIGVKGGAASTEREGEITCTCVSRWVGGGWYKRIERKNEAAARWPAIEPLSELMMNPKLEDLRSWISLGATNRYLTERCLHTPCHCYTYGNYITYIHTNTPTTTHTYWSCLHAC